MATQIDNSFRSFSFASAISANTLVAVAPESNNGAVAVVTASFAIGVVQEDTAAAGIGSVKLFHPTQFGIVSPGPVTAGFQVFAATGGGITGGLTAGAITLGVAIQSGATGDIIEYAPTL
jgi:hypothetical protein